MKKQEQKKKLDVWGWLTQKKDEETKEHECCGGEGGCCGHCEEDHAENK